MSASGFIRRFSQLTSLTSLTFFTTPTYKRYFFTFSRVGRMKTLIRLIHIWFSLCLFQLPLLCIVDRPTGNNTQAVELPVAILPEQQTKARLLAAFRLAVAKVDIQRVALSRLQLRFCFFFSVVAAQLFAGLCTHVPPIVFFLDVVGSRHD